MRRKKLIEIPWDELKKYFGKVIIVTRDHKIEEFEEGVFSTKTTIYESCVAILDDIPMAPVGVGREENFVTPLKS